MKVRFTPRATNDIAEIADYIRRYNPYAATKVRDAILATVETIALFPKIGRLQNIEGIRRIATPQYRI
jgi:plasmid stabilization system protein ParE